MCENPLQCYIILYVTSFAAVITEMTTKIFMHFLSTYYFLQMLLHVQRQVAGSKVKHILSSDSEPNVSQLKATAYH